MASLHSATYVSSLSLLGEKRKGFHSLLFTGFNQCIVSKTPTVITLGDDELCVESRAQSTECQESQRPI